MAVRIARLSAAGELWFNAGMTLFRIGASFALTVAVGMALGLWMVAAGAPNTG